MTENFTTHIPKRRGKPKNPNGPTKNLRAYIPEFVDAHTLAGSLQAKYGRQITIADAMQVLISWFKTAHPEMFPQQKTEEAKQ